MNEKIYELKLQGYCCSQVIMGLGLKKLGKENPDLIRAMAGLCNGMRREGTCGILSAANCLLYLACSEDQVERYIEELFEWFEDAFRSTECNLLIGGKPLNKVEKCPAMEEATFLKICELLDWEE